MSEIADVQITEITIEEMEQFSISGGKINWAEVGWAVGGFVTGGATGALALWGGYKAYQAVDRAGYNSNRMKC